MFQTSATGGTQSTLALPAILDLAKAATGKTPNTAGIIGDNTASPVGFLKPMREGGLAKARHEGLDGRDLHAAALRRDAADPEACARTGRSSWCSSSTNISDLKLGLEKLNEFRLAKGVIPIIGNGAHMGAPEVLKNISADLIEGVMFIVADWGLKGQESIIEQFKKRTGEPWMTQDSITGYGDMWILKEALERAGVADKVKVNDEIHKMDLKEGPATIAFPGPVKFDAAGRREGAPLVIVQWQNGVPVTVFPVDRALGTAKWPKA